MTESTFSTRQYSSSFPLSQSQRSPISVTHCELTRTDSASRFQSVMTDGTPYQCGGRQQG